MDVLDILNDDGGLKVVHEWLKVWHTILSGLDILTTITNFDETKMENILKKIKWPDKVRNLELLGNHIAVQAFKEQASHEYSGLNGGPIKTEQVKITADEAAEAYRKMMG